MNRNNPDYSNYFTDLEPEEIDITPHIIAAGVKERDFFWNEIYTDCRVKNAEEIFLEEHLVNEGNKFVEDAIKEVYLKNQKLKANIDVPKQMTKKAKTVTAVSGIIMALLIIGSFAINFM